ncbi:uracil-DNA glycosylase [Actinomyces sp. MRS3W]|uniref:uracil-DNA glycosylase n=1 Tax=Actinomyces sp. MRS3W TaxID=2800796 RepID=UPI0028FD398A|nr:uracil-DNA glycosylase [Actinomyces sp. MRS3W]MDU0348936.1 uracil-DNA glycosylase [Actinomyces sp. MRS3W]
MSRTGARHPITGEFFDSPVPPGTGWPDDPADPDTPVAACADDVERLANGTILADLDARVSVCRACPRLVAWREEVATTGRRAAFAHEPYWGRPVPSLGPDDARIYVVGLAPAANGANRTGRMFTGDRSGDWLFAAFHRAGLARLATSQAAGDGQALMGVRMGAAVRCAPPANRPTATERATCAPWLTREVSLLPRVRVLLALGGIAWDTTLRTVRDSGWDAPRPKPKFGHGAQARLTRPDGREVVLLGCYHPSQQNTFTGRLTADMLDAVLDTAKYLAGL